MGHLMECGHTANAHDHEGNPVCVICVGLDPRATQVSSKPDLTGRTATCCGNTRQSSYDLPFFEYRGPGSRSAVEICVCGYYEIAHNKPLDDCPGFVPRGEMQDLYYCGHSGWD